MLQRFWMGLGKLLAWLLLPPLLLAAVGLGLGTLYYHWKFSGPVAAEEQIPADEGRYTQAIIEDAIRIVEQHRDNTRVLRDAHAKAHGCVKAELSVLPDLNPELRHGVFSEPGKTWQSWVRFSNGNAYPQFDATRDARGMAVSRTSSCSTTRCFLFAMLPNTGRTSPPRPAARKSWPSFPAGTPGPGRFATC